MISRVVDTRQQVIVCAVCGRSLLRGEHASMFIDAGVRREVCELCSARAAHDGWIREGAEAIRPPRPRGDRARSIVGRWRTSGRPDDQVAPDRAPREPVAPPAPQRRVHAVPSNGAQKAERALDLFNGSDYPRMVAGVARSLGAPAVAVNTPSSGTSVEIIVGWELCWYQYAVDLEGDAHSVSLLAQGDELTQLEGALAEPNAVADERGQLTLATSGD